MKPVILAAKRTPIGSFVGAFKDISAVDFGVIAAYAALEGLDSADVADVIVGNVLQAGQGMNPARQIALKAELPICVPAQKQLIASVAAACKPSSALCMASV